MVIDVSSVLKEAGAKIVIDDAVALPEIDFGGSVYRFKEPLRVRGSVSNTGTVLMLEAECEGVMTTQCARCMRDIDVPVGFGVSETLAHSGGEAIEDAGVFEGHTVVLDEVIENSLIMSLEPRYLCREDCKGLCLKCGADLNEGSCGCETEEIDPRWAALADLMKKK